MARKTKETLLIERLHTFSDCPGDVFRVCSADEELFELIKRADSGNPSAITELAKKLYEANIGQKCFSEALIYWCMKGVELKLYEVAELLVSYVDAVGCGFDRALSAIELIKECPDGEVQDRVLPKYNRILALSVIDKVSRCADFKTLTELVDTLPEEYLPERVYILSSAIRYGKGEGAALKNLLRNTKFSTLLSLPTVANKDTKDTLPNPDLVGDISDILRRYDITPWREFWLRCLYEYADIYLGGNYVSFAPLAKEICEERRFCPKGNLYALSWLGYIIDNTDKTDGQYASLVSDYENLRDICIFDGILADGRIENREEIMREGVYCDSTGCRIDAEKNKRLGHKIVHERNRYSLTANLCGHGKRGRYHFWETTVAFPLNDKGEIPVFEKIRVDKVMHELTRKGVVRRCDPKKTAQFICSSEITLGDTKHPFTLDLIADIAYVCAVKCVDAELKIRETKKYENYYVIRCGLYFN